MAVIAAAALARASSSWLRCRMAGSAVRACSRRLLISARVSGAAGRLEPLADLGADQRRVGEQGGDVVPYDGVQVVGADRFAVADLAVLEPVVVAADAPVVEDLVAGAGGGVAVVAGVSAGRAGGQALQQG